MRQKKVWRYWCDFCNKGGCSGGCMKRHEASCCKNPARICRMCPLAKLEQKSLPELIQALGDGTAHGVENLRRVADGCPACMLAAIMQSGLQRRMDVDDPGFHVEFEFKKERDSFFQEVNSIGLEHY